LKRLYNLIFNHKLPSIWNKFFRVLIFYSLCSFSKKLLLKISGSKVCGKVEIQRGNLFMVPGNLDIKGDVSIGRNNFFQSRAKITIGKHVNISGYSFFMTGSHDVGSPDFKCVYAPITMGDYAWIGINSTILPGVTIGEGAVVAASSVVTKDVPPYTVVAGCPAVKIKERARNLNYKIC